VPITVSQSVICIAT